MREIKFRAWDLDNHFMYYQDRDHDNGEGAIIWTSQGGEIFFEENQLIDKMIGSSYHDQYLEYRKPNQIIMQYTGLKDKNGEEIYEGDILRLREYYPLSDKAINWMGEIKFYSGCFWFDAEGRKGNCWFQHNREDIEVIGNIYENPELLKAD